MLYHHIIDHAFEDSIGNAGAKRDTFVRYLEQANASIARLRQQKTTNTLPLLNQPECVDDIAAMETTAAMLNKKCDTIVVLGTGGSTLNPQAMVALAPKASHIVFADHIDPDSTQTLLSQLNLKRTGFLAISKSGRTVETLSQTFICVDALRNAKIKNLGDHFVTITDPVANPLRQFAHSIGATILDHELNIGGRFSSFTNVGLLPALLAGVDIRALRKGAAQVIAQDLNPNTSESAKGAALAMALLDRGIHTTVLMPYVERLKAFSVWYQQIWAESLGKNGKGSTPIRAIGTLDQHSQLQLYLGGPRDKFITLITLECQNTGPVIPAEWVKDPDFAYLKNRTLGDVNAASQQATADTLIRNGCPLRRIHLPKLDAETLGALFMHFSLETIIMADLLGVNAFDQPAVEEGKVLARQYLAQG